MINKETHTRFWVTLKNDDFEKLSMAAKELNLSVSAYAGQIVSNYLHVDDKQEKCESVRVALTPEALNEKVMEALKNKAIGDEFTIREIFLEEEWAEMSRSEKAIAAKILASIERSSHDLKICDTRNKTSIYKKI